MSIKNWLFVAIIMFFALVIAACGSDSEGTTGDGQIELTVAAFGDTNYHELIEEYMENNSNVKVNYQHLGDTDDHHSAIFTSISAGSGAPDAVMLEIAYMDRFRDIQEGFHNLYDLGAGDYEDLYLEWKWQQGRGQSADFQLAFPTDIGPTVAYYRMDVFEEAGLPSDPDSVAELISTWDKFKDVAATIYAETGKPIVDNPNLLYNALRDQSPEHYFNENDELIIETSPYMKRAYDYTVDLIQAGYVGNYGLWSGEWNNAIATGDFAIMLAPAWMQGPIMGAAPDATEWNITSMPEGAGNWGGSFFAIPAETSDEKAAAAFDLLTWMLAPEQQVRSFEAMGLFPSAKSALEDAALAQSEVGGGYFNGATAEIFAEAAKVITPVYTGLHYQSTHDTIVDALTDVNMNGDDPEEKWNEALDTIKAAIRE